MWAEIEKLQQFISEWDSTIKSLNIEIAGRDDVILKRDAWIRELEDEIKEY